MYPLKKSISIALGLLVLAAVAVVITTGTVGASPSLVPIAAAPPTPSIPVNVTNTPLAVTGTVNANINGTPTVNANLTGTPNVHVTTDSGAPLVIDPDAASARNSVSGTCGPTNFNQFGEGGCSLYTVPSGYNLIVENGSEQIAAVPLGEYIQHAEIGAENIPPLVLIGTYLVPAQVGTNGAANWYAAQASARLYYGPGTNLGCSAQVFGGTSGGIYCSFSGHLSPL
jgi:hypothetical protein